VASDGCFLLFGAHGDFYILYIYRSPSPPFRNFETLEPIQWPLDAHRMLKISNARNTQIVGKLNANIAAPGI